MNVDSPKLIESLSNVLQISTGAYHSICLTHEGKSRKVFSFGSNSHGQLGLGDREIRSTPTLAKHLGKYTISLISCSSHHSVFVARDMLLYCGNSNELGFEKNYENILYPICLDEEFPAIVDLSCGKYTNAILLCRIFISFCEK